MKRDNDVYNRILEIACGLFAEKGYQAATTREIAELAGISRGHLRYYFGKKEELFYAYFAGLREKKWKDAAVTFADVDDPRIFAMLLLRSYTELICSFHSEMDLETLQGYEIISKYENRSEVMVDLICAFASERGLSPDRWKLSTSVEIAGIIIFKFAFDLLNQHRRNLQPEEIWYFAAQHGLFAYGIARSEIEELISAAEIYIKKRKGLE